MSLTPLDAEPAATDAAVASLRMVYDAEVAETWLPVSAEDLLVAVLAADRTAFARPGPPLSELAASAGLEQRDGEYAHDASVWRAVEVTHRHHRMIGRLGPGRAPQAAVQVLALIDEDAGDAATAREILGYLYDADVLEVARGGARRPGLAVRAGATGAVRVGPR